MDNKVVRSEDSHLEPRVARLETGLEMLTRDVAGLSQVVRDQGSNIEKQIRDLAVGITQAAAPRKTDWQTLIALVMLIMAIGSAVYWPLSQTSGENKIAIQEAERTMHEHSALQLHPVGQALLMRLEGKLDSHIQVNERDNKLQNDLFEREISLMSERIDARLNKLEISDHERNKTDLDELRALKYRAFLYHMGPCPSSTNGNGMEVKFPK